MYRRKHRTFYIIGYFFIVSACSVKTENQPIVQEDTLAQAVTSTNEVNLDKQNLVEDTLSIAEVLGKINPAQHADFVKLQAKHTDKTNIYLRKATYEAFQQMYEAAAKEGIRLKIISATRNFADQKKIWEKKWNGSTKVGGEDLSKSIADPAARALKILEYSSMPGTSRHHWGTDMDLNNLNNAWFASGEGKKIYEWLQAHAGEYGFCQPYSEKGADRPDGYNEEKWHWSYMPLAHKFLQQYTEKVIYEEIDGFEGAEVAAKIHVIDKYVKGIAPACK
jgi:zinc D-Ala-D-Ala carboxypeptidase